MASLIRPMLATLADAPLRDPNLVYEPKYDGIRVLAEVGERGRAITLWSRLGNDKTAQFPEVTAALERWAAARPKGALLDGEIVALDRAGRPLGFQRLQERIHLTSPHDVARLAREHPVALVAFDLLRDGAEDLCPRPLAERRRRLEAALGALGDSGVLRLSLQAVGDGTALLAQMQAAGGEGLVVKDARSIYRPGQRTRDWRKLKLVKQQELLIGGWTEPRGTRSHLGALLLGVPESAGGVTRLRYAGHVGGGFTEKELVRLSRLLAERKTSECPFSEPPPGNERLHWVRPDLVAQVRFSEWTDEGLMRHPVYLGLRDDVKPGDVRREDPPRRAAPPEAAAPVPGPGGRAAARLIARIEALERGPGGGTLELPDGALELTNLGKLLWPRLGITKGELLRYYLAISPVLLPIVRDRPLVMRRFPDGVERASFYQHRAPDQPPPGVRVEAVEGDAEASRRLVGGSLSTLVYMTQLGAISQDPWFSRVPSTEAMDFAAIDLDPMEGAPFRAVRDVALWVRDALAGLGVEGFPKTSGSRGLHVYLPMRPRTSYETGLLFCEIVATLVVRAHPKVATIERTVRKRAPDAVYVDCLQNIRGKTLACAYSARASDHAGASAPVTWKEIEEGLDPRELTLRTLPARVRQVGDLWARFRKAKGIDLARVLAAAQAKREGT